jgi:hypothetical protein
VVQQQTQFTADNPVVVREAFAANLPEAAALPDRVDQLNPLGVNDAEQCGRSQEGLRPVLLRHERPRRVVAVGEYGR